MKAAQNSGFEKLVVAGEPLSAASQKELKENQDILLKLDVIKMINMCKEF